MRRASVKHFSLRAPPSQIRGSLLFPVDPTDAWQGAEGGLGGWRRAEAILSCPHSFQMRPVEGSAPPLKTPSSPCSLSGHSRESAEVFF